MQDFSLPELHLESLNYEQVMSLRGQLDAVAASKQSQARTDAMGTITRLANLHGFKPDEINRALKAAGKARATKAAKSGNKVAPKYRNPLNLDETWTGRGVAPVWIRDVPKDQRDQFLIADLNPVPSSTETPDAGPAVLPISEAQAERQDTAEVMAAVTSESQSVSPRVYDFVDDDAPDAVEDKLQPSTLFSTAAE